MTSLSSIATDEARTTADLRAEDTLARMCTSNVRASKVRPRNVPTSQAFCQIHVCLEGRKVGNL